jgi:AraC-like DNA-binding protein
MNALLYSDPSHNALRSSVFEHFQGVVSFEQVALKYVHRGQETYRVNHKKHVVEAGQLILGNHSRQSEVHIHTLTEGLCIDIAPDFVHQIAECAGHTTEVAEFLTSNRFPLLTLSKQNSAAAREMAVLAEEGIQHNAPPDGHVPHFLVTLTEAMLDDAALVFTQIKGLPFRRSETRSEVFVQLKKVKDFIDRHYLEPLQLDDLTPIACISKFALVRQFRLSFGLAPYKYIQQKRLEFALQMLQRGNSVQDTAFMTRFADSAAFSKAFRRHFGLSPTQHLK